MFGKSCFIASKAEFEKLDINKLVITLTSLNNSKTTVYDLEVNKSKTVSMVLKKLNVARDRKVVANTKFSKLNTKINNLEHNSWNNYFSTNKSI